MITYTQTRKQKEVQYHIIAPYPIKLIFFPFFALVQISHNGYCISQQMLSFRMQLFTDSGLVFTNLKAILEKVVKHRRIYTTLWQNLWQRVQSTTEDVYCKKNERQIYKEGERPRETAKETEEKGQREILVPLVNSSNG